MIKHFVKKFLKSSSTNTIIANSRRATIHIDKGSELNEDEDKVCIGEELLEGKNSDEMEIECQNDQKNNM
jgi:hypothetical protein